MVVLHASCQQQQVFPVVEYREVRQRLLVLRLQEALYVSRCLLRGIEVHTAPNGCSHPAEVTQPALEASLIFCIRRHSHDDALDGVQWYQQLGNDNLAVYALQQIGCYGAEERVHHVRLAVQTQHHRRHVILLHRMHYARRDVDVIAAYRCQLDVRRCRHHRCTFQTLSATPLSGVGVVCVGHHRQRHQVVVKLLTAYQQSQLHQLVYLVGVRQRNQYLLRRPVQMFVGLALAHGYDACRLVGYQRADDARHEYQ